ncbi:transposase [Nonomuraea sp. NPDC050680]|uniref:transposase n=1 Tax=Nonomuraea sp. NPDC050680 TaxID=3154630 RepID=UPI0033F71568
MPPWSVRYCRAATLATAHDSDDPLDEKVRFPRGEDAPDNGSCSIEGSFRVARPSKFGDEFKRDAVRLVRTTGRACADVARELGMTRETLRTWVREAESYGAAGGRVVMPRTTLLDAGHLADLCGNVFGAMEYDQAASEEALREGAMRYRSASVREVMDAATSTSPISTRWSRGTWSMQPRRRPPSERARPGRVPPWGCRGVSSRLALIEVRRRLSVLRPVRGRCDRSLW